MYQRCPSFSASIKNKEKIQKNIILTIFCVPQITSQGLKIISKAIYDISFPASSCNTSNGGRILDVITHMFYSLHMKKSWILMSLGNTDHKNVISNFKNSSLCVFFLVPFASNIQPTLEGHSSSLRVWSSCITWGEGMCVFHPRTAWRQIRLHISQQSVSEPQAARWHSKTGAPFSSNVSQPRWVTG